MTITNTLLMLGRSLIGCKFAGNEPSLSFFVPLALFSSFFQLVCLALMSPAVI